MLLTHAVNNKWRSSGCLQHNQKKKRKKQVKNKYKSGNICIRSEGERNSIGKIYLGNLSHF